MSDYEKRQIGARGGWYEGCQGDWAWRQGNEQYQEDMADAAEGLANLLRTPVRGPVVYATQAEADAHNRGVLAGLGQTLLGLAGIGVGVYYGATHVWWQGVLAFFAATFALALAAAVWGGLHKLATRHRILLLPYIGAHGAPIWYALQPQGWEWYWTLAAAAGGAVLAAAWIGRWMEIILDHSIDS